MHKLPKLAALLSLSVAALNMSFAAETARPPQPARSAPRAASAPVSLLELMRASIEIPADGIWAAQAADKLTEEDWQLADQDSINLLVGTSQVLHVDAGKEDGKKMSAADFQAWTRELQKSALSIRLAVKARDQKKMSDAADHLQEVCEACHTKYRPQMPSDGVARYPFYPKREFAK